MYCAKDPSETDRARFGQATCAVPGRRHTPEVVRSPLRQATGTHADFADNAVSSSNLR